MLKIFLFLILCVCLPFVTSWRGLILGPGRWLVLNILKCDNPEQYDFIYEISRTKINRTHDCFSVFMDLDRQLNSSYAIKIDIYQKVDGGYKYFQTMEDDYACKFIMSNAEENTKRALTMTGIDPPDCPFGPHTIKIQKFVMDYTELPKHGVYGTFTVYVYALLNGRKLGCININLNFDQRNDDDSDELGLL